MRRAVVTITGFHALRKEKQRLFQDFCVARQAAAEAEERAVRNKQPVLKAQATGGGPMREHGWGPEPARQAAIEAAPAKVTTPPYF